MTEKGVQLRTGMMKQGWEISDFPIVCESCMGENPYVRMMKSYFNKECKICCRPFTVFRWRPGAKARYKKTEICQTCAKAKNICQTCMLDLDYGLPVEVRDKFIQGGPKLQLPKDEVNRNLWAFELNKNIEKLELPYGKESPDELLQKLAPQGPNFARNEPLHCSFFVKGSCNRGSSCPYKHEMPPPTTNQPTFEERYEGVNDPIAERIMRKVKEHEGPDAPQDKTNMTLYIGGVNERITEKDLKSALITYGRLKSVKIIYKQGCAFATFATREGAELAIQGLHLKFFLKNMPLTVTWGKKQSIPQRFRGPHNPVDPAANDPLLQASLKEPSQPSIPNPNPKSKPKPKPKPNEDIPDLPHDDDENDDDDDSDEHDPAPGQGMDVQTLAKSAEDNPAEAPQVAPELSSMPLQASGKPIEAEETKQTIATKGDTAPTATNPEMQHEKDQDLPRVPQSTLPDDIEEQLPSYQKPPPSSNPPPPVVVEPPKVAFKPPPPPGLPPPPPPPITQAQPKRVLSVFTKPLQYRALNAGYMDEDDDQLN